MARHRKPEVEQTGVGAVKPVTQGDGAVTGSTWGGSNDDTVVGLMLAGDVGDAAVPSIGDGATATATITATGTAPPPDPADPDPLGEPAIDEDDDEEPDREPRGSAAIWSGRRAVVAAVLVLGVIVTGTWALAGPRHSDLPVFLPAPARTPNAGLSYSAGMGTADPQPEPIEPAGEQPGPGPSDEDDEEADRPSTPPARPEPIERLPAPAPPPAVIAGVYQTGSVRPWLLSTSYTGIVVVTNTGGTAAGWTVDLRLPRGVRLSQASAPVDGREGRVRFTPPDDRPLAPGKSFTLRYEASLPFYRTDPDDYEPRECAVNGKACGRP